MVRDIGRLHEQLTRFEPFLSRRNRGRSLADFDQATEQLLSDVFGTSSELLEAYEYAKLGEAASLLNVPEEAQEDGMQDVDRESLQQRKRVLESAVSELEAHRAADAKTAPSSSKQ